MNPLSKKAEKAKLPAVGTRLEEQGVWLEVYSRAALPTSYGEFDILVIRSSTDDKEHVVLIAGNIAAAQVSLTRIHSECLTGEVFGSLRCDCRLQLEKSLQMIAAEGVGVLLYLRQEGRGIGLGNKVRAYALQDKGMDTFEANRHLGFDDDLRDYRLAAMLLRLLGIGSIRLATNNPAKLFGMRSEGLKVTHVPLVTDPNPHNADYLTSKVKAEHLLPLP
ncbi:MAG: GTP cyclohydrolase II [Myxococcota bacterium]